MSKIELKLLLHQTYFNIYELDIQTNMKHGQIDPSECLYLFSFALLFNHQINEGVVFLNGELQQTNGVKRGYQGYTDNL